MGELDNATKEKQKQVDAALKEMEDSVEADTVPTLSSKLAEAKEVKNYSLLPPSGSLPSPHEQSQKMMERIIENKKKSNSPANGEISGTTGPSASATPAPVPGTAPAAPSTPTGPPKQVVAMSVSA